MAKMLSRFVAIFAVCTLAVTGMAATAEICIDAGHGGSDPGAVGNGQQEKTNVLNTALKFRNWLNSDTNDGAGGGSWAVVMTRSTDVYVSLQGRCDIANNNASNRFMCIHNNALNGSVYGTETFCVPGASSTTTDLRNKVQDRMIQAWNRYNRGVKTANFYVLVHTAMAAELAELAFIDNVGDSAYTGSSSWQDVAGKYHMFAVQNHYGITAYTPGNRPTYTIDNSNAGFSCSANWSTGTSATDKYGTNYRFRSTAALSDAAQWTASVVSGSYRVDAWWPAGTNRSATAPYILPNNATVNVNQQANGGKWNALGTVSLSGAATTKLSCWTTTGYVVMADAIRYVPN